MDLAGSGAKYATVEEMKNYLMNSGLKMNKAVFDTRFFMAVTIHPNPNK
jgi:hypothetical protein